MPIVELIGLRLELFEALLELSHGKIRDLALEVPRGRVCDLSRALRRLVGDGDLDDLRVHHDRRFDLVRQFSTVVGEP